MLREKNNSFLIFLLILTISQVGLSALLAANGIGYHGAAFLRVSPAARQVAMGEASSALADDIHLMHYNIGGLSNLSKVQLAASFHNWIDDTQQGDIALALPCKFGVFGFDFTYFNEGKIVELDEFFRQTGGISYSDDIAVTVGFGSTLQVLHNQFGYGGGIKIIRQNLVGQSSAVLALDLGTLYRLKKFSFAASIQNLGLSQIKYQRLKSPLAQNYRLGAAARLLLNPVAELNLAADLAWTPHEKTRPSCGVELCLSDLIALRSGIKFYNEAVSPWSAGFGLNIPMQWLADSHTRFDYAYSPMDAFEVSAHRVSLVFTFGMEKPAAPDSLSERLKRELDAAERARLAAEQMEQEIASRLSHIKQIAEQSQGKIEVQPKEANRILVSLRINFDFDKANIRKEEYGTMHQVAEILNTYPEAKVHISGHTDFIGTEEYNINLSQRRVDSVMVFLGTQEKVDMQRFFMPIGYGESKPIASNSTDEGRFRNRRVEFLLFTFDAVPEMPQGTAVRNVKAMANKTIHIECNGKVNFTVNKLADPDRLVIDFPGIYLLTKETTIELNQDPFLRARLGFHPGELFTRVVIDLARKCDVDVHAVDNVIEVKLRN